MRPSSKLGYALPIAQLLPMSLEMIASRLRWLDFADGFVEQWTDTRTGDAKEAQGVACYAAMVERIDALLADRSHGDD